ncbi:LPO_1073/Vpar_1526 family protein [Pseudomonas atacamensis]|uniref:LPO_1073/Vpar_1526 family protein n=1 Tax=Pseudomonas atacamensis TaxID=2565368 RepID=UPI0028B99F29|nr:LPO_1073/Vpar_1526 family protein [Pseudomonas atacamensis]MDT6921588.1 hypothetical protein [Pseudomonas atacamensis]
MLNKDQNQQVGAGGVAIQAGNNVVVGVSAREARDIAMDVSKGLLFELSEIARGIVSSRVEEITDKVFEKIEREYPAGLQQAVDPDFQYALYTVQKQYGRTGDVELGDLLVDLLVDRSKQDKRDLLQIVLTESLEVAPKLTGSQISNLSMLFLFRYTMNHQVECFETFGGYLDKYVQPFVVDLNKGKASFQHLAFTGCGADQLGEMKLENILQHNYTGLFFKGFNRESLEEQGLPQEVGQNFIIRCLNDNSAFQINCLNTDALNAKLEYYSVQESDRQKINNLFGLAMMSAEEIIKRCTTIRPYMSEMFSVWNDSDMKSYSLTSVGMSIGHANIKRCIGEEFANLSIWIC